MIPLALLPVSTTPHTCSNYSIYNSNYIPLALLLGTLVGVLVMDTTVLVLLIVTIDVSVVAITGECADVIMGMFDGVIVSICEKSTCVCLFPFYTSSLTFASSYTSYQYKSHTYT